MSDESSPDVVFVHGAWVGPRCWDSFKGLYEKKGLSCLAPSWPLDDRPYEALRSAPAPELARVGVQEVVAHYESILRPMKRQPLLVGHSFGGLFVQMLLDRGLGSAGVAIDSAPPKGVMATPTAVRAGLGVLLSFFGWRRVLEISRAAFSWGFVHELSAPEQAKAFDEHVIPTPGRPFFQAAFAPLSSVTKVRYDNADRAPLLLVAGERDRTVPAAMNRANFAHYQKHTGARDKTAFKEFSKRSHWIIAEPGWEEVAEHSLDWARSVGAASR